MTDFLHSASCLQVHPGVWCVCIGAECGSVAWLGDIFVFMYSWLGGHADYFRFLAARKRAATKIRIQVLLRSCVPFFKLKIFFFNSFLVALGLHCHEGVSPGAASRATRALTAVGYLVAEHRLRSTWAYPLLGGMWNLPRPGIKPVSPVLAGGSLTTGPAGRSWT